MALVLTEEQEMLKKSAHTLLQEKGTIVHLRKLRDDQDPTGYDRALWQEMADMGWASLTIPEVYGGLDFGYTGLGQVLEQTGRHLTASPLVSTVLLSATAIELGGTEAQKASLLPAIAAGELVIAFAHEEGNRHNPSLIDTQAQAADDHYLLSGTKTMVLDGHVADNFLVVSRLDGSEEVSFFIVDAKAEGVQCERIIGMDSRNNARLVLENVKVPASAKMASTLSSQAVLDKVLDIGRIGLAAEMLGGIQEAFSRTLTYLKEREQFEVKIGSFQALQHRMATLFSEIELCKSVVIKALQAIDEDSDDLPRLASLAKAKLGKVYEQASNEGIQLFGGIGMTDDEEIGFFLKRARVVQRLLGDRNFHLDRLARMRGY